jgi:hypothetical protein
MMTGKEDEARAAAKEVLKINPKFSVGRYMQISTSTFNFDPEVEDRLSQALRKAGLPE